jgi:Predicted periplasmic protein
VSAVALLLAPVLSAAQPPSPGADKASVAAVSAAGKASKAAAVTAAPTAAEAKTAAAVAAAVAKADAADAAASPAPVADSATAATPATPAAAPAAPLIEPEAAAALKRSSEFLQELKTFSLRVDASTDEVLDSGQKVQFGSLADISVVKPNRLRVDVIDDDKQRQFYYDGRTLTVYGKLVNYYASVKAPKTIKEMLAFAESKYGLEWPLADLLAPESLAANVKSGFYLGKGRVRGVLCDHYAFRQDDVDWQIWIQEGKTPLPRKIVITTKNEEAAPQYAAVLSWNLSPSLADSVFRFVPPKRAGKIVLRELEVQPGNEK